MKFLNLFLITATLTSFNAFGATEYEIEKSINDETFIINGEVFKAKTYCFNVDEGDKVIFISGSASGACASATFINLKNGNKCEVWCE